MSAERHRCECDECVRRKAMLPLTSNMSRLMEMREKGVVQHNYLDCLNGGYPALVLPAQNKWVSKGCRLSGQCRYCTEVEQRTLVFRSLPSTTQTFRPSKILNACFCDQRSRSSRRVSRRCFKEKRNGRNQPQHYYADLAHTLEYLLSSTEHCPGD